MMGKVSVPGTQSAAPAARGPGYRTAAVTFGSQCRLCFRRRGRIGTNDLARLRTIRLGEFAGSRVTVLAGLKKGERVVTGGKQNLVDGALIRVVEVRGHTWHT